MRGTLSAVLPSVALLACTAVLTPALLAAQDTTAARDTAARPGTYTVKRGDNLWDLARRYLADPYLWPQIYRLNTSLIRDPHWIYPGEVLTLPGALAAAPAPAVRNPPAAVAIAPAQEPEEDFSSPTIFAPRPRASVASNIPIQPMVSPPPVVRLGEYLAAPYVAHPDSTRAGKILGSAELEGIASAADPGRYQPYSTIYIAPAKGTQVSAGQLLVAVTNGPLIERVGQVVVPTGIIRVTRASSPGVAAVGQVLALFNEVRPGQRLVPYDTSAIAVAGQPAAVRNGRSARVQWISSEPVLPSVQSYLVLDIRQRDGVKVGDQFELYRPPVKPTEVGDLTLPDVPIAVANVVRVTPYATTAIIMSQIEPKIAVGTMARLTAQMP